MDLQLDGTSHGAAYSDLMLHRMLQEVSTISSQLDPTTPPDWIVKRVQFLAYDLRTHTSAQSTPQELCDVLNQYFFHEQGFSAIARLQDLLDPAPALLLHRVLTARAGAPAVLSLIYSFLACQIGLRLEFVDLRPTCFLKFIDQGISRFIDLTREGHVLSSDDLLESLHTRFHLNAVPASALLDPVPSHRFMTDYLLSLKVAYVRRGEPAALLLIQNALMNCQPSSLQLLGERALLYRRLGQFKNALADLKRYFSFNDREHAPAELIRAYDELRAQLERHRNTMQILE
ncbi:MAG: transglutaminase-like domain-containing protein [Bdellovibrionaceae bacterium]|nr:transglutaminase-like domain-containing protein [Pseudobdellovibrionaceae bacterium]